VVFLFCGLRERNPQGSRLTRSECRGKACFHMTERRRESERSDTPLTFPNRTYTSYFRARTNVLCH